MKRSLHGILCCPICKGELTLAVTRENDDEILEGTLTCASCRVSYPIEDGIPDLIPRNVDAGCVD